MVNDAQVPSEVVRGAGAVFGTRLADEGFSWLGGAMRLQRRQGGVVQQIHFQMDKLNRRDGTVVTRAMLNVRDPALRRWRAATPDRVLHHDDYVCGHPLGYASGRANGHMYGDATDGDLDLTDPAARSEQVERFVAVLRDGVLPWFAEASDPSAIVTSRAGDYTNDPSALVEWLACRHRLDLIDGYVQRYLARNPGTRDRLGHGVDLAATGRRLSSQDGGDTAVRLGWSSIAVLQ